MRFNPIPFLLGEAWDAPPPGYRQIQTPQLLQRLQLDFFQLGLPRPTVSNLSRVQILSTIRQMLSLWTSVNLNLNQTDPLYLVPAHHYPIRPLCFNFNSTARLFTVPGLSYAYFSYPTSLVQCAMKGQMDLTSNKRFLVFEFRLYQAYKLMLVNINHRIITIQREHQNALSLSCNSTRISNVKDYSLTCNYVQLRVLIFILCNFAGLHVIGEISFSRNYGVFSHNFYNVIQRNS